MFQDKTCQAKNIPKIHLEGFPVVIGYYHNHEFDHEEKLDYHFL